MSLQGFKLSLPTDVPWDRIGFSEDMIDTKAEDYNFPQQWKSSVAIFRYDPAEEYQTIPGKKISYLKVSASITPFSADFPTAEGTGYAVAEVQEFLESGRFTYPCFRAMLQVSITPKGAAGENLDLKDFPYFSDFEPKKREFLEAVTETGEKLNGSGTLTGTTKSGSTTTSDSNSDSTTLSASISAGYGPVGATAGVSNTSGTNHGTVIQGGSVEVSDTSTERRETQSHSTNITQLYNVLQSFHVGTNRAIFLMDPRPHITNAFLTGEPRMIEGIQDFFLVVISPVSVTDICVNAKLDTVHLGLVNKDVETREESFDLVFISTYFDLKKGGGLKPVTQRPKVLTAPEGWEIDFSVKGPKGKWGFDYEIVAGKNSDLVGGIHFYASKTNLTVSASVKDVVQVVVTLYLKQMYGNATSDVQTVFVTTREVCSCDIDVGSDGKRPGTVGNPWEEFLISKELDVSGSNLTLGGGNGRDALSRSRTAERFIKDFSEKALKTTPKSEELFSFFESQTFRTSMAPKLKDLGTVKDVLESAKGRIKNLEPIMDLKVSDVLSFDAKKLSKKISQKSSEAKSLQIGLVKALISMQVQD